MSIYMNSFKLKLNTYDAIFMFNSNGEKQYFE